LNSKYRELHPVIHDPINVDFFHSAAKNWVAAIRILVDSMS
jgi:hypothetical protein